jgi:hypothetical protein
LRVSLLDALGGLMSQPAYFSHYGGRPRRVRRRLTVAAGAGFARPRYVS